MSLKVNALRRLYLTERPMNYLEDESPGYTVYFCSGIFAFYRNFLLLGDA